MAATRRPAASTRAAVLPFPRARRVPLAALLPSLRVLAAGFAIVAVAVGGYAAARLTPVFAVEQVEVRGASPSLAAPVRGVLGEARGESLLALDLGSLEGRVLDLPEVASAQWDRAFPNRLVVTVEPESPAAVLRRGSDAWLLSERGRVLRPLGRGEVPGLPRIWGPASVHVPVGGLVEDEPVRRALRALLPVPSDFPVHVRSATAGDSVVLEVGTGLDLRLGAELDVPLKLAVAASIVPSLEPPAEGGPDYLDVSVPERPVTGFNPKVEGRD